MKTALIGFVVMLGVTFSCRPVFADIPDGVAATNVVDKFYRTCLKIDPIGFPTALQMKRLAPIFSRDLNDMIGQARGFQSKLVGLDLRSDNKDWRAANVFTSLPAGFDYYGIGLAVIQDDIATVPVHLEYHHRGRIVRWLDVVVLERHGSGRDWRVVDIYLNAPFAFANGASLRARLHDMLTPPPPPAFPDGLVPLEVPGSQPSTVPSKTPRIVPPTTAAITSSQPGSAVMVRRAELP